MNLIRRYLMVVCVGVALLVGIQVPNFLDQYAKRVDAHLLEATRNFQQYQDIANKYHNSSLYSLIASHKVSQDPSFREEGSAIEDVYNRKRRFEMDKLAISNGLLWNAWHIVTEGNHELLKETVQQYSYAVPLNRDAITSGVISAMTAIFCVELIFSLLGVTLRRIVRRPKGAGMPATNTKPRHKLLV